MRQLADKEELGTLFSGLTSDNRRYILAIARALTFAQGTPNNLTNVTVQESGIAGPEPVQPQDNNRRVSTL